MLAGDELLQQTEYRVIRNERLVTKQKEGSSAIMLVPTLFEMSVSLMRIRCRLEKQGTDEKILAEFSKLESAIVKATVDVEYLRRKGH